MKIKDLKKLIENRPDEDEVMWAEVESLRRVVDSSGAHIEMKSTEHSCECFFKKQGDKYTLCFMKKQPTLKELARAVEDGLRVLQEEAVRLSNE